MSENFKKTMDFIGLNHKKELTKIFIANLVVILGAVAAIYFTKMFLLALVGLVTIGGVNYAFYFFYENKKAMMLKNRANEFVYIVSYFRIFIENKNNVYQSFNKLLPYCSEWMKENIETMLRAIDVDKSLKPFTDFADKFDFPVARNAMISIYQMVEEGEGVEHINQFTILFEQMNQRLNDEKKERKSKSFDIINFFPIIGAGLVTIALTFSMLSVVGDMVNVI